MNKRINNGIKRTSVNLYDLSGTLIQEVGRKKFFRENGIEWAELQYGEPAAIYQYAKAMVAGIKNGCICIRPLRGVKQILKKNQEQGILNVVYSAGRQDEIKTVIQASGLKKYISFFISTLDLGSGKYKTKQNLIRIYKTLLAEGKEIKVYCDDSEESIREGKKAAKLINKKYGTQIQCILIVSKMNRTGGLR